MIVSEDHNALHSREKFRPVPSRLFLTLLERKDLGHVHIRKGPNKVGFIGILQPYRDAIKLFTKEQTFS